MAQVSFIDDAIAACSSVAFETCTGIPLHKASGVSAVLDVADDGATTDIGQSSASETESSSGLSSSEGSRNLSRRCRFGQTSLETIPATPAAATMPLNSPPGFSRAAMREARDACMQNRSAVASDKQISSGASSHADSLTSTGAALSRFGDTPFGTVPKTPVGKAKLKNLKSVFGSPPGLSRTEKRQARDACKGPVLAETSWGTSEVLATGAPSGAEKRHAAQGKLAKVKEEAALLKDLGHQKLAESEASMTVPKGSVESDEDTVDGQNCRFDSTSLGTMPSTPARKEAATTSSPPGLSRKSMRQARDACTKAASSASTSWATRSINSDALTISPAGKPMTPPAERAARQRAARDAMSIQGWGSLVAALPRQASQQDIPR